MTTNREAQPPWPKIQGCIFLLLATAALALGLVLAVEASTPGISACGDDTPTLWLLTGASTLLAAAWGYLGAKRLRAPSPPPATTSGEAIALGSLVAGAASIFTVGLLESLAGPLMGIPLALAVLSAAAYRPRPAKVAP